MNVRLGLSSFMRWSSSSLYWCFVVLYCDISLKSGWLSIIWLSVLCVGQLNSLATRVVNWLDGLKGRRYMRWKMDLRGSRLYWMKWQR